VGFLTTAYISLLVNILQFSFSLSYTGIKVNVEDTNYLKMIHPS